jgi:hypothetical protein
MNPFALLLRILHDTREKQRVLNIYEATWFADRGMVLFQEDTWPAKVSSIRQAG